MNNTIKQMESVRADYLKWAKMAREDEQQADREAFLEIVDLISMFINTAKMECLENE